MHKFYSTIKKNKSFNKFIHYTLLLTFMHATFVAPAQNIILAYWNSNPQKIYKGGLHENTNLLEANQKELNSPLLVKSTHSPNTTFLKNHEANKKTPLTNFSIKPDIEYGVIGVSKENPLDNPQDNLFIFSINEFPTTSYKVFLSYELSGVQSSAGISRSINDRLATGGYLIKKETEWFKQKEEIKLDWLQKGENKIMFSVPLNANYQYKIKNVKIEFEVDHNELKSIINLSENINYIKDNTVYVRGFLNSKKLKNPKVYLENESLLINEDEFEGFFKITKELKNRKFLVLKAKDDNGFLGQEIIPLDNLVEADNLYKIETTTNKKSKLFTAKTTESLKVDGIEIETATGSLKEDKTITIQALRNVDIAPLGSGMINVTKGGYGYRFLPDGTIFESPVKINIAYDEKLIPKGYSEKDIKTFYFNTKSKSWVAVKKDTTDTKNKIVISQTNHFTDYINGIIQTPESPETDGFTSTMMNDIKTADPSSEMTIISPPQVSQKGEANVYYPIKIPSGRKGMQPQLAIQYNSDGGTTWLGQGWNISTPSIAIDTRWGVPLLDPQYETEIYTLGGEQLMYPKLGESDWMPNRHYDASSTSTIYNTNPRARINNAIFTPRKQGSFSKIERVGNSPKTYYWKVTSTDGTISWYGGKNGIDENAVIRQGGANTNIVNWALLMVEDVYGNNIKYYYNNNILTGLSSNFENLNNGKIFYLDKILYTGFNGNDGNYKVEFKNEQSIVRKDISISSRLGVKQIEPYRLDQILISHNGTKIRSYKLDYIQGAFEKSLLNEIKELDASDNLFYSHKLEYYDDVFEKKALFDQPYEVSVPDFNADFSLGLGNLIHSSAVNSSESTEVEWGVRPSIGIQLIRISNNPASFFTIGAPFGESTTQGKGKVTMVDIDGDGLEDVVYKNRSDGRMKFFKHRVGDGNYHYFESEAKNIFNINNFQKIKGWTKTMFGESWDFNALWRFYAGTKRFKSKEKTSIYFTDGNGDGLMDIVNDDKVYFNTVNTATGEVGYTTSSSETPNMLITAKPAEITPEDVPDTDPELVSQNDYDVVRVWEAPRTMTIRIVDSVQFSPSSPTSKAVYSIETSHEFYENGTPFRIYLKEFNSNNLTDNITIIGSQDNVPLGHPTPNEPYLMRAFAGQKFYFRLHKNKDGKNDRFVSNPKIEYYQGSNNTNVDQNGLRLEEYIHSNDFLLSSKNVDIPAPGSISVSWPSLSAINLSDDVTFKIIKETTSSSSVTDTVLNTWTFNMGATSNVLPNTTFNYSINNISETEAVSIRFEVTSDSNVDWKKVEWKPKVVYQPTNATAQDGTTISPFTKYAVPIFSAYDEDYKYNYMSYDYPNNNNNYYFNNFTGGVLPNTYVRPDCPTNLQLDSGDNGEFLFVFKKNGIAVGKRKVKIINGQISLDNTTPINVQIVSGDKISPEFYVNGTKTYTLFKKYVDAVSYYSNPSLSSGTIIFGTSSDWSNYPTSDLNHFARARHFLVGHNSKSHLGTMHRGWGQFLYNGKLDTDTTIPEDNYGKLINNNIVENPIPAGLSAFGAGLGGNCSPNLDPQAAQDCVLGTLNSSINTNIPAEGENIDPENLDEIVTGIQNNPNLSSLNNQTYPLIPMSALRKEETIGNSTSIIEKWIGFTEAQYSAPNEMKNGDIDGSSFDASLEDNPDIESALLQADLNTGMNALTKEHRSSARSYTAGWGTENVSTSKSGYSDTVTDFLDLNGDRYPDLLSSNEVQFTNMTGGHNSSNSHGWSNPNSSDNDNSGVVTSKGYFASGRKEVEEMFGKQDSGNPSINVGVNLSANLGGRNKEKTYWIDINGDGLTDNVKDSGGFKYQLNKGTTNNTNPYEPFNYLSTTEMKPGRLSPSFSIGSSGNMGSNATYSISLGYSKSKGNAEISFQDLNGDGLVDLLEVAGDEAKVRFNNGNGFSNNQFTLSNSVYTNKPSNENNSASLSGSFTYYFGSAICCWIPIVYLKFGATVSGSANLTISDTKKSFKDFDGDGYVDYVISEGAGRNIKVYPSNVGRTNKLKAVHNPLGGYFVMDYESQKTSYSNPNARWAMSRIEIYDGYDKINDGKDLSIKSFKYENGYYDRRERDFYGYETVKTSDYAIFDNNSISGAYRTSISKYHNKNYFLNGLLKESYVIKGEDENLKYSRTENTYEIKKLDITNNKIDSAAASLPDTYDVGGTEGRRSATVIMTKTKNYLYELQNSPQITTEVNLVYDEKGRIKEYIDLGDTNVATDNYTSKIAYHDDPALLNKNIINVPKKIEVFVGSNLVRERSTTVYTASGFIQDVFVKINNTDTATTTLTYDSYGNLKTVKKPINHNNQNMVYTYSYDTTNNKYVTLINDSQGYSSSSVYNELLDKITETTDLAGNKMQYEYDSFGRNTIIRGPKEIQNNKPYTIKFKYFPRLTNLIAEGISVSDTDFMPVALTKHYDVSNPTNDIETLTFMDGFGRPVQVKKDISLNTGTSNAPTIIEAMSLSGKTTYDEFGRSIAQYHPYYETKSSTINYKINEYNSPYKSETEYDELDRVTKTIDPDGNTSINDYSLANDPSNVMSIKLKSIVQQNLNQDIISETYKDVRGKVIATKNVGPNGDLWTKFSFNAIGELISYTDAEDLSTTYTYDLAGRKKSIEHPDNGTTKYEYDIAGNLIKLQTQNLANDPTIPVADRFIKYYYDYNRLTEVNYPDTPSGQNISNVTYQYAGPGSGNQTGRLIKQIDASGQQEFEYGNMGEITTIIRTVVGPNIPTRIFKTGFNYDSWNRLMTLIYPDGEEVTHTYDLGGNLKVIKGMVNDNKYYYVQRIDYDYYEQKTFMLYGNNTKTSYNYTPSTRRLTNLNVKTANQTNLFNNNYTYDKVGNVLNIANSANSANTMGGNYSHSFKYDNLNRLVDASGEFIGDETQANLGNDYNARYSTSLTYNSTHGIETKNQSNIKNDAQYEHNTYQNSYKYISGTHKVNTITDAITGLEETYNYDLNGNLLGKYDTNGNTRNYLWDESNRLRVSMVDDRSMQHYIYDAAGERVLKTSSDVVMVYQNGTPVDQSTLTINGYTTYPNAFIVVDPQGIYSKHYYVGNQRIVSRVGESDASIFEERCVSCKENSDSNDKELKQLQILDLQQRLSKAKLGKATFKKYEPVKYEDLQAEKESEITGGEDRPTLQLTPPPPPMYYYHPDHLGTSTFLTDFNGIPYQFFLNLPFGETMAEQRGTEYYHSPYKFNGKELDEETGLYYYGARYYDPRASIWLSVDPLAEKYPAWNPYNYTMQNPINLIDPDGREPLDDFKLHKNGYLELIRKTNSDEQNGTHTIYNEEGTKGIVVDKSFIDDVIFNNFKGDKLGNHPHLEAWRIIKGGGNVSGRSEKIFKFLADNTDIEWNLQIFQGSSGRTVGLISTSYTDDSVSNDALAVTRLLLKENKDIKLLRDIHNHPGKYQPDGWPAYPSGFGPQLNTRIDSDGSTYGDRGNYIYNSKHFPSQQIPFYEVYVPSAPNIKIKYNGEKVIRK